jgi:hypothetical protein
MFFSHTMTAAFSFHLSVQAHQFGILATFGCFLGAFSIAMWDPLNCYKYASFYRFAIAGAVMGRLLSND